jgi:hypothetical protein
LVDRFNLGNLHPNKEWWRERRIAPATFMGFPDVTKAEVRGGSLYTEQMDAATLAVIVDKCVSEKIMNPEFWAKFSWRTQQLCPKISETEAAYLFRGFSRADWVDSHLLLSLWGRVDWLLPRFTLGDLSVVVEGLANANFRNDRYATKFLNQMLLLVEAREDWTPDELCRAAGALGLWDSGELGNKILKKIAHKISSADLSLVSVEKLGNVLLAFANLKSGNCSEAVFAITTDLEESGKLLNKNHPRVGEDAVAVLSALVRLGMAEVSKKIVNELLIDYYDNIYRLSHGALVRALSDIAESGVAKSSLPDDHCEVLLRRIARECYKLERVTAVGLLTKLVGLGDESDLKKEAISECVDRILSVGVKGVQAQLVDDLHACLEKISNYSEQIQKLNDFVRIARLE